MQLRPEQLAAQSSRGLPPVVLISGDEPLQVGEAADTIRRQAKAIGCAERVVMDGGRDFDWRRLQNESHAMALFVQRRLIELRLPDTKVGRDGSEAIVAYTGTPPPETHLLIICGGRLDKKTRILRWCKAIDHVGWVVPVWSIETARLPQWVSERMRAEGLRASREACMLLAERMEGNLLACVQEIKRLTLLRPDGVIEVEDILNLVADNARYDVFVFSDAALSGELARLPRVLNGLRQEGVPETLVLWALQREIRNMLAMQASVRRGRSVDGAIREAKVWPAARAGAVRKGLIRHGEEAWRGFLIAAGEIDRTIKGREPGSAWDKLLQLGAAIAGFSPAAAGVRKVFQARLDR